MNKKIVIVCLLALILTLSVSGCVDVKVDTSQVQCAATCNSHFTILDQVLIDSYPATLHGFECLCKNGQTYEPLGE